MTVIEMKVAIEDPRQYLLDWVEDEFRRYPQVRIRLRPLQERDGVTVRTETREYFFETDWVRERRYDQMNRLAAQIQNLLDDTT